MRHLPPLGFPILICLIVLGVRAERLPVKIFTSADGLGSSFVDDLYRDSRGFMWFCTRDGLSRFDGARFITYRVGDKNSPPGIEVFSETSDGSYWITTTGGFYHFNATAMSRPDKQSDERPFLNAEYIDEGRGSVLEDRQGNIWYVGQDLYLARQHDGKFEFERKNLNLPVNPRLPLAIFQSRLGLDGSIWMNTNQGLVRRLPDGRITLLQHETSLRLGLAALTVERNGRVWVAWGGEIYVLQPVPIESLPSFNQILTAPLKADSMVTIEPEHDVRLPDRPGEITRLTKSSLGAATMRLNTTSDGHVWLDSNAELLEFDGRSVHAYGAAQGLPTGMADIEEDAAGNLWIGGRSLARLDRRGLISYYEEDGLQSSALFAINEATDGT